MSYTRIADESSLRNAKVIVAREKPGGLAMKKMMLAVVAAIFAVGMASAVMAQTKSCESLAALAVEGAKVVSAERVEAGAFVPPGKIEPWMMGQVGMFKKVGAFCRVVVRATPSADSDILIEVWMPVSGWNGKFQGQGNGGFAGDIGYFALGAAVMGGYATAGTNTGHTAEGTDASWALGHPEKVADYGYRGIHEMTRIAKEEIEAYYAKAAQHSYFGACSNGGRQALMEAQRYPEDYDGILAGAPANYWTHLLTEAISNAQALTFESGSYIPSSKLPAMARAVNAACDAKDGVTDGVLNDPQQCDFKPEWMLCKKEDSDGCLTAAQVTTLKKLYAGAYNSQDKKIFPGYLPGAEDGQGGWGLWITGTAPGKSLLFAFGTGYFSNMVYEKADWNYKDAKLDDLLKAADEKTEKSLNATDADLSKFKARGGKLILYHGWNDPAISALNTIDYYGSVMEKMGKQGTEAFTRLYMVPGMQHCGGGPGATAFGANGAVLGTKDAQHNISLALEQWVEKGVAPGAVIAAKYENDDQSKGVKMTRPLCPYPQVAKYKGNGDTNDAGSFVCGAEK
jgi:Tannase and feruloyl esterase